MVKKEEMLKRIIKICTLLLLFCLIAGTTLFFYNAHHRYTINHGFTSLALQYDPEQGISQYSWNGFAVTVKDGFVKGIQKRGSLEHLVIRALSPMVRIEITNSGSKEQSLSIDLENINPELYGLLLDSSISRSRVSVNTLEFSLQIPIGKTVGLTPSAKSGFDNEAYVVLGDNRDGYETFGAIIEQVNAIKPAFVIDNGDLVFSGKPNQYRLFDQMVANMATTVCTTLGNHDIRGEGRSTYTQLYGPPYYAFDLGGNHYVFLDSSRGYAQKTAIPEEQYAWLERDLKKAQGKRITVISHIPPTDPRSGLKPNEIEAYTDKVEKEGGFVERKLEAYSENESIDHGFRDKTEAQRFENLMTRYGVQNVYLSHIHSYFDSSKDGVRYIISGGGGAELLTQNSYYHFLIAKPGESEILTMVELPSPPNLLLQRYWATIVLFAQAMYTENIVAVTLLILGFVAFVLLLILLVLMNQKNRLAYLKILLKDTFGYMVNRSHELHPPKE
ncbi:MAG: metallophosphoesterase [Sphaerochaeta sp.]|uniref:metallophosphoesterase family protein n=1 Tax=Sphaerochaeta sp. TaxID=1972642 RepID=UPI002FCCB1FB